MTGTRSTNKEYKIPRTEMKMANALNPADNRVSIVSKYNDNKYDLQGPTLCFAWKEATLAKQHIARKLKNTWAV